MAKKIEIQADFDILIDGIGQVGTTSKLSVPNITQVKESHISGTGEYEISIGQLEKMEASCVILREETHFYKELSKLNDAKIDFIEAVKEGSQAREGLYEFRGIIDIEGGDIERKNKKEITLKISITSAFHSISGVEQYQIDFENNICRIGGVDHLEKVRSILGGA